MKRKFNSHVAKADASRLHRTVFDLVRARFPGYTVLQEHPFEVIDEHDRRHVLFLDIYLKELDIAIECQGRQHFEANSHFFSGGESVDVARDNDRLKRRWCEMNDVALVYVNHDDKVDVKLIEKRIAEAVQQRSAKP